MKARIVLILSAVLFITPHIFAQENSKPKAGSYSLTTDFYVAPDVDYIPCSDKDNTYAKVTSLYSASGGRVTFRAKYYKDLSLDDSFLLNSIHLDLEGNVELTPLTVTTGFTTTYSPFPFLELQSGTQIGTGWNIGKINGLAEYNKDTGFYEQCNSFSKLYFNGWIQFLLQFDTGVIWPGKWNHIVMQYTYRAYYNDLFGTRVGNFWFWPPEENRYAGFCNYQCLIIAYQMPTYFFRAGFMFESDRHYSDDILAPEYKEFNGTYNHISISQITQWKFSQNDILSVAITFATRRGFAEYHKQPSEEPLLTYIGNEWYFKRVALSFTHNF